MNLVTVAARNALRNKLRTSLTVIGAAVAVLAFIMLRTVLSAWNVAADHAAKAAASDGCSVRLPPVARGVDAIHHCPLGS